MNLRIKTMDPELVSLIEIEAFRRYGHLYGSRKKWIIEAFEEYLKTSKKLPRFSALTLPSPVASKKKKNIGKIEQKSIDMVDELMKLNDEGWNYEVNPYVIGNMVKKVWTTPSTWKEKTNKITNMYLERMEERE